MKYSQWIGILAAITLVIACFIPWTYHPDVQKNFTGFFSENNLYGRPGKFFVTFAIIASIFFLIPRVWAKRWNLLFTAIIVAFAIRCFLVYTGCYHGICPEKKAGIWLVAISSIVMLLMAVFPDTKLPEQKKNGQ
ncbi:hypothetical protein [Pseudobacter ginsenosidimutans]|uniref:Uncharacterized protein n=1 Tax=Pseudobacter ginsenosidimutans TaxID=661488 RepID=A0A4Q7N0I1_9BACT|nr:hypothetical protein [Pseudobacter ginsenosidimutans]QEC43299.1 hypothetical protein FSB84_16935 [Pseudobacter ginsenosidimutans]RZS74662.1 hypothetical protein EV199_0511 [Pseudobacter ginsenosidimutans]